MEYVIRVTSPKTKSLTPEFRERLKAAANDAAAMRELQKLYRLKFIIPSPTLAELGDDIGAGITSALKALRTMISKPTATVTIGKNKLEVSTEFLRKAVGDRTDAEIVKSMWDDKLALDVQNKGGARKAAYKRAADNKVLTPTAAKAASGGRKGRKIGEADASEVA